MIKIVIAGIVVCLMLASQTMNTKNYMQVIRQDEKFWVMKFQDGDNDCYLVKSLYDDVTTTISCVKR